MTEGPSIGSIVGNYRIEKMIGRGGMGAVYMATHTLLGRKVAIKVLLPGYCKSPELVKRFFNEARATTAIDHAGIVQVFDFGIEGADSAFIVMELLTGESLQARLERRKRLPAITALRIIRQLATALECAHDAGVVHRDLKPDNIFLVPDLEVEGGERVKILDFGIAKLLGDDGDPHALKTRAGTLMGTPFYMAPEQCRADRDIDHRADIYALGCVLYHMLCGRPPFIGQPPVRVVLSHVNEPTPDLRSLAPDIPEAVEQLTLCALAKEREQRYPSMGEFAAAITRWLGDEASRFAATVPQLTPIHQPVCAQTISLHRPSLAVTDKTVEMPPGFLSVSRPDRDRDSLAADAPVAESLAATPSGRPVLEPPAPGAVAGRRRGLWTAIMATLTCALCVLAFKLVLAHTGDGGSAAAVPPASPTAGSGVAEAAQPPLADHHGSPDSRGGGAGLQPPE